MNIPASLPDWIGAGAGAGMGGVASFYLIMKILDLVGARADKKEAAVEVSRAQVDAATQTLIAHMQSQIAALIEQNERLTKRIDTVESELEQCREQHAHAQEEIAQLRGATQGLGDARQQAAAIVAADRVQDRRKATIVERIAEKKG